MRQYLAVYTSVASKNARENTLIVISYTSVGVYSLRPIHTMLVC